MESYHPPLSGRLSSGRMLLDFNERVRPLPDEVLKTLSHWGEAGTSWCYPEYEGLEPLLAEYIGCSEERVFFGNGSDQLLDCVFRAVVAPGDEVLIPNPSFAMYAQLAGLAEAKISRYSLLSENPILELRNQMKKKPKMVVVCNPNNPTGTLLEPKDLVDLFNDFPDVWFMVDEAYAEFSRRSVLEFGDLDNVVVTRTLSKAFGLASLRFGYMIAHPDMNEQCGKIRGPYDVNTLAGHAAKAVMENREEVLKYRDEVVDRAKPMLETFLEEKGLEFLPSQANFLLLPSPPQGLLEHMEDQGFRLRKMSQPELKGAFRVSIGDVAATRECTEAMASFF
jgi:histidinol-phosphate aminotransferase